MNAKELVRQYSELQAQVLASLRTSLPNVRDWEMLTDVPKHGRINAGAEDWRYLRHGAGVQFVGEVTGRVVDAHVDVLRCPTAIDAWRLSQYCEAIGIATVECDGRTFSALEERELGRGGVLVEVASSTGLWLIDDHQL